MIKKFISLIIFVLIIHIFYIKFFTKKSIINNNYKKKYNIPKIIYRIWIGKKIPKKYKKAYDFTKKNNREYKQIIFNEKKIKKFLLKYYKNHPIWGNKIYNAYYKINKNLPAARSDFFRYILLYEKGGIYLDMKSAAQNLNKIIKVNDTFLYSYDTFISRLNFKLLNFLFLDIIKKMKINMPEKMLEQWWLITSPKNIIFKNLINDILHKINNYKFNTWYNDGITDKLPNILSKLYKYNKKNPNKFNKYINFKLQHFLYNSKSTLDVLTTTGPILYTKSVKKSLIKHKKFTRYLNKNIFNEIFIYDFDKTHIAGKSYCFIGEPVIIK